jgi:hypothetical protein
LKITLFRDSEREKLLAFQKVYSHEPIRLLEKGMNRGHTVYLEQNGEVQGIATLYHNAFHPHFEHIQFALNLHNTQQLTVLYHALLEQISEPFPRLSIHLSTADAKVLEKFLEHHRFAPVITTACPRIDLEHSLRQFSKFHFPVGYRLNSYDQLNFEEAERLRHFRLKGYAKTHFWSPPLNIEHPYWQEADVEKENQHLSWVVLKDQAIVLCSDAHREDEALYLGWGWHDDVYTGHPELQNLWATVLKYQVKAAQDLKVDLIGEFDSLDVYGQYKSALLTHLTEDNYFTYHQVKGS